MNLIDRNIGIIGGSGDLGKPMSLAFLSSSTVNPSRYWISNRSGSKAGFEQYQDVQFTTNNQELADACDIIILCVPPAQFSSLSINASNALIISVMAGVTNDQLMESTGSNRTVRAISSPAAGLGLAYSAWVPANDITDTDKVAISSLFDACGSSDELSEETQIEVFTAMTGPVPGFVAFYADCMSKFAVSNGVPLDVANRSVTQLFLGAGTMMASTELTPAEHVDEIIDYNGTTAAGLKAMQQSSISEDIALGLVAAIEKTRVMSS